MYAYCLNNPVKAWDPSGKRYMLSMDCRVSDKHYIEDQNALGIAKMSFSLSTIGHGGCGVVATYNALLSLGENPSFEAIRDEYVARGEPILFGLFGMDAEAVEEYFLSKNYSVKMVTSSSEFDECINNCDVAIVYYTWKDGNKTGRHFFSVDAISDQNYAAHNLFGKQTEPYPIYESFGDFMETQNVGKMVLICISEE